MMNIDLGYTGWHHIGIWYEKENMHNQEAKQSDHSSNQNLENENRKGKVERTNTPVPHSRTSRHSWRERPREGSERRQSGNTHEYPRQRDASDRRDNYGNPDDGIRGGGKP
jgi:hypothetical protein